MDRLFIEEKYLKILLDIFNQYCPNAEIWVYGSRINGTAHPASDIDLVVKSFNDNDKNIFELKILLNESNVPFLMDINEFEKLPKSFQEEIERDYLVLTTKV